ncbi:hypothetical protein B0J18DRAFT_254700 [Chaetomium sp. MPI-SDFR-AT-0129]|nr:hypothetical protein B0J18DRAFT_254700 [Chaetomium sp. MPI-SDFR-AT-0129]
MPTDTTTTTGSSPTTGISESSDNGDSGIGSNRTFIIALSTVLSVVGLVLIAGTIFLFWRKRQRGFLSRGVSPIDDDEIERWKSPRDEKTRYHAGDTDLEGDAIFHKETCVPSSHSKQPSSGSVKKPPSVIVYNNLNNINRGYETQGTRHSTDADSRRSFVQNHPAFTSPSAAPSRKTSFDNINLSNTKGLPQLPIQARAPNARAGLTDESVPGDEPFLYSPKRTPSRLSKLPSNSALNTRRGHHARARSSRSSARSFGDYYYPGASTGGAGSSRAGSDLELAAAGSAVVLPRHSHDQIRRSSRNSGNAGGGGPRRSSHSRVYSSSSIPPRLSMGDEVMFGGLSPARPRFPGEGEIGRAIG